MTENKSLTQHFIGKTIQERYQIESELFFGPIHQIFKGKDLRSNRAVAIKILREHVKPTQSEIELWKKDIEFANQNDHQMLSVREVGVLQDPQERLFLVEPLLQGQELSRKIAKTPLLAADAVQIAGYVISVLEILHAQGIYHLNLKPSNLFEVDGHWLVSGIGTHHFLQYHLLKEGKGLATPTYIAPELVETGMADAKTDIYFFGILMYEIITGRTPFLDQDLSQAIKRHVKETATPIRLMRAQSKITKELNDLLMSCLSKNPNQRPTLEQLKTLIPSKAISKPTQLSHEPQLFTPPPQVLSEVKVSESFEQEAQNQAQAQNQAIIEQSSSKNPENVNEAIPISAQEQIAHVQTEAEIAPKPIQQAFNRTVAMTSDELSGIKQLSSNAYKQSPIKQNVTPVVSKESSIVIPQNVTPSKAQKLDAYLTPHNSEIFNDPSKVKTDWFVENPEELEDLEIGMAFHHDVPTYKDSFLKIFVILIAAAVGLGGYYFYQKSDKIDEVSTQSKPNDTNSAIKADALVEQVKADALVEQVKADALVEQIKPDLGLIPQQAANSKDMTLATVDADADAKAKADADAKAKADADAKAKADADAKAKADADAKAKADADAKAKADADAKAKADADAKAKADADAKAKADADAKAKADADAKAKADADAKAKADADAKAKAKTEAKATAEPKVDKNIEFEKIMREARTAFSAKDYAKAESELAKASKLKETAELNKMRGQIAKEQAKNDLAVQYFKKSLKQNGKQADVYLDLGMIQYKLAQYKDAQDSWTKAESLGAGPIKEKARKYLEMVKNKL